MLRFISSRRGVVGTAVLVGGLLHASCGDGGTAASSVADAGDAQGDDLPVTPAPIGESVKSSIGAAGGSITSADGRFRLDIPAGALAETREIELQQIEVADGWGWSMLPHGTTFAAPVDVTLSLGVSDVPAPDKETDGNTVSVTVQNLVDVHVSRPPASTDTPLELAGAWNEDTSKLVFSGHLDHFSDVIFVGVGAIRWVSPLSAKVGETSAIHASRLVESEFTEQNVPLTCAEGEFRTLRTFVRKTLTGLSASSNASFTVGEGVSLGIPGVDGFKLDFTCKTTGKASLNGYAPFGYEREAGAPWPNGCTPRKGYAAHTMTIDCTAPGGMAGRYLHTAAPGSCDDDTSTTAWYVHENGAITNDFSAGCTNGAGTAFQTPFAMWEVSEGTLTADDCTKQVDATIGAVRSLTFNSAKNRWEGTEDRNGTVSQVCLTGPEPWDFTGKCVATGCQVVDVTCNDQPQKLLNNCEACPSTCTGCSDPRPWPWEATVTPVCY